MVVALGLVDQAEELCRLTERPGIAIVRCLASCLLKDNSKLWGPGR